MNSKLIFQIIASLIFFGASFANGQTSVQLTKEEFVFDGLKRSYYLSPPIHTDEKEKLPVVFILHGGGKADGNELAKYTSFIEIAGREGFIAVFPNGVDAQWNDGRGRTYRKKDNTGVDDVGFISALIDTVIHHYKGDPSRIYVTGLSNGGMMTLRLGCELSSKLAAIAPVIANIPKNIYGKCDPDSPLPILLMNGTKDPLVPWDGGYVRVFRRTMGKVVSTEETINFWVKQNHCDTIPEVRELPDIDPNDDSTVKASTYANGEDGSEVILYTIEGGGHSLPGSDIPEKPFIIGKKNKDIDGTEVIWEFFKQHKR